MIFGHVIFFLKINRQIFTLYRKRSSLIGKGAPYVEKGAPKREKELRMLKCLIGSFGSELNCSVDLN